MAGPPGNAAVGEPLGPAEVRARLNQIEATVRQVQERSVSAQLPEHLVEERELLKRLDLLFSQQQVGRQREDELRAELEHLTRQVETSRLTDAARGTQASFLELDDVLDELNAEQARRESLRLELLTSRALVDSARQEREAAERQRRQLREALEDAGSDARRTWLPQRLALARLRCRVYEEAVAQQELDQRIAELESRSSEVRATYLQDRAEYLRSHVRFSEQDLNSRMAALDRAEAQFRQQLTTVQARSQEAGDRWLQARQRGEPGQRPERADDDPAITQEEIVTWALARDLLQEQASLIQQVLAELGTVRVAWRRRYALANRLASDQELANWQNEIRIALEGLDRFEQLLEIRANERRDDLATLRKRLLLLDDREPQRTQWLEQQVVQLQAAVESYGDQLVLIKSGRRLLNRFSDELRQAGESDSATQWMLGTWDLLRSLWDYEITTLDDRPVTVSKLVRGAVLLLVGYLVARILSGLLGRHLLPRLGMNPGASLAFQSIAFYLLLVCFGLLALELINLPLTVFAFMGGAVAIGVGFGSQNVLNNFISGLILLAERPIRVGDLVDIEGLNGTIERIGARSTRVKTGSNLEIIVPNSKFLENNVTNWTLSDTRIRMRVAVGVAYGSPTREVQRLLHQAVASSPNVLAKPEPTVLFKDFGDNALQFEVHFWVQMRTIMEGERIASDVRLAIDDLLAQAKITIAFPQRDVHLDVTAPIEVNVRSSPGELGAVRRRAA